MALGATHTCYGVYARAKRLRCAIQSTRAPRELKRRIPFVLAWESFRSRVVEHVHMLYWCGIDETGHNYQDDEYRQETLARNKSPFRASLAWYREMGAIDNADLESIDRLSGVRNRLVHDLMSILGTASLPTELANLNELARVFRKVEVWQLVNVELAGDPDWEGKVRPASKRTSGEGGARYGCRAAPYTSS